jgi:inosose dehydratase
VTALQQDRFGVDLITLYDGSFWSVADWQELADRAAKDPRWFWDRTLDSVRESGVTGIELTFPPGNWDSAIAAYGSIEQFAAAVGSHGLAVTSSYFSGLEYAKDISDAAERAAIVKSGAETARLIKACGADVLVAGLPPRPRREDGSPVSLDLHTATPIADLVNELGAATLAEGVRLAIHTEMGSVLCAPREIDLFMMLTDAIYVGLCPDTGHIVLGGGDPVKVLDRHSERVLITHWKDATGPMPAWRSAEEEAHASYASRFGRVGTGAVDWFAWSAGLREAGFEGWNILEIDVCPDPLVQITAAREFAELASHRRGMRS